MRCPFCGYENTKVIDSRSYFEGNSIKRRRECENCGKRFTTHEKVAELSLTVIKKNGQKQPYSRDSNVRDCTRIKAEKWTLPSSKNSRSRSNAKLRRSNTVSAVFASSVKSSTSSQTKKFSTQKIKSILKNSTRSYSTNSKTVITASGKKSDRRGRAAPL